MEVPEQIGPYKVHRALASGGMATVYEAEDEHGEPVAIKLLTQRGLATPRFAREYQALARLDHANIVRVYRYGVHQGYPWLSMELLDGVPVQVHARATGRPGAEGRTREVARVGAEVAEALAYLHARGIVHRDLKSNNIMVLLDGRVKLLDFGTASVPMDGDEITHHGEFVGTYTYAAPEQLTGGRVQAATDLYALGVLLYRLLTGRRPFEADSAQALARMHVAHRPTPPRRLVPELPPGLEALVLRLLEKDPADRPTGAAAVRDVLRAHAGGEAAATLPGNERLVGRAREVSALRGSLQKARPGRLALVVGPPGSGRSRLLQVASAMARQDGWRTPSGRFGSGAGLEGLGEVARSLWGTFLPGREPDLPVPIEALQALDGLEEPVWSRAAEAVATVLAERAQADGFPILVALADVDLASPLALEALARVRHLVRQAAAPVVFVASAREESDRPGGPLRQGLADAWRLELRPLGVAQTAELMGALLGGHPVSRELARRVHAATGGLPGYVGELVRALVDEGVLVVDPAEGGGRWREALEAVRVPRSAEEAVLRRLDGLSARQRRVLEAVAVGGRALSAEAVAWAVDLPVGPVRACLEQLEARSWLRRGAEWEVRLELVGEVVRREVGACRRHLLQRRLASALADTAPDGPLVELLLGAGRVGDAVRACLVWADPLVEGGRADRVRGLVQILATQAPKADGVQPADLARLFILAGRTATDDAAREHLLARAEALAPTDADRCRALVHLTRLRAGRGDLEGAGRALQRARSRLARCDDPTVQWQVEREQGVRHWLLGELAQAEEAFDRALAAVPDGTRERARVLTGRGVVTLARGRLRAAESDLREATRLHTDAGDAAGRWHAQGNLADALRHRGAWSEALGLLEGALPDVEELGDASILALTLLNLAELEVAMLRWGQARRRLTRLRQDVPPGVDLRLDAGAAFVEARLLLATQEPDRAREVAEGVLGRCGQAGTAILRAELAACRGAARVLAGDAAGVTDLDAARDELLRVGAVTALAEVCACRASALADREDPDDSFGPVQAWLREEPALLCRVDYLVRAAAWAEGKGRRARAQVLWQEADAALATLSSRLTPADRHALEVHPWYVRVARALGR